MKNPVAKHCYRYNKPKVVESKKAYQRREKHKGRNNDPFSCLTILV